MTTIVYKCRVCRVPLEPGEVAHVIDTSAYCSDKCRDISLLRGDFMGHPCTRK